MSAWFASDLHLDPNTPEIARRFIRFLSGPAREARALYLLGDLFEAWVGDDDPEPAHRGVMAAIAALADTGTLVCVMRGNRDFLIGERFCAETGALLLEDPAIVAVGGTRVILTHGDGLCIDDRAYQRLRALVRDPVARAGFRRLSLDQRRRLAGEARAGSRAHLATAPEYITDVNAAAVEALFRSAGASVMVHGHTHRPAVHESAVAGEPARRYVLGDWHATASVLHWDAGGPRLLPCPA
ncbi:MAG: UDP-2,3-diacylglucosamine diphosphatase [Steroidobacteraceae bacterium]|nr:UDP-2,3-diacylglucosamine diphosphatase [Steroidobacteraceae bacterium]